MHIVFFSDQPPYSLGGAQVSMRLQRTYLEKAGHTVTIVAPRQHRRNPSTPDSDPGLIELPSRAITRDGEYALTWPTKKTDRIVDSLLAQRPPVDIVHVQADFWGAFIGHRFAKRHGLALVHTMHNRVDVGIAAVTRLHRPVLAVLNLWRRWVLRGIGNQRTGFDGWAYLQGLAQASAAVTAPSTHFARRLEEHGVFRPMTVSWNGIDDDQLNEVAKRTPPPTSSRPRLVWLGRMSPEKRLLPFLEAVAASGIDAEIDIIGDGAQHTAAQAIAARTTSATINILGRMQYPEALMHLARADAVVQTSIGFETQGMTPFEAAVLGTPAIISDPDIGAELGTGIWLVPPTGPSESERIPALASTLQQAVTDIKNGTAPLPEPRVAAEFRQSSRTDAMIQLYQRVLSGR